VCVCVWSYGFSFLGNFDVIELVGSIYNRVIFVTEYTMQAPSDCAARRGFC